MKKQKPKSSCIYWEIIMAPHCFTVEMQYENGKCKTVNYQFEDDDDFFKQMKKFKRHNPSKELIQDVFNKYVHEVADLSKEHFNKKPKKQKREKKEKKVPEHGRGSVEYNRWRMEVLERDNHMCVMCGETTGIEVHHIRKYKDDPNNIDPKNGVTLCHECHRNSHIKGEKIGKDRLI